MKSLLFCLFLCIGINHSYAQQSPVDSFWVALQQHCGKAFKGTVTEGGGAAFDGKELVMKVAGCSNDSIIIPFFVGDDYSRTWILTRNNGHVLLKHDHRHEDGTADNVTFYGGLATNAGSSARQIFPADVQTCELIPYACGNVWWITVDDKAYTYNLHRIGTDRVFTVTFNLSKTVDWNKPAWGWENYTY